MYYKDIDLVSTINPALVVTREAWCGASRTSRFLKKECTQTENKRIVSSKNILLCERILALNFILCVQRMAQ